MATRCPAPPGDRARATRSRAWLEHLDDTVEEIHEEPMPAFTGLNRLVRRNDDTVRAVLVNGKVAWRGGTGSDDLGTSRDYGRVLPLGSG